MFGTGQPRVVIRTVAGVKRDCFASLPEAFALQARLLPQPVPLEVVDVAPPHRRWLVAWAGHTSSASDCLELSQDFANSAGIPDGLFVRVHVRTDLPRIVRATVMPESEGDWDVVGFSAEASEEQILSQIGIIEEGLIFPLWINNRTLIRLKVLNVEPGPAALLVVGSELTVLQPEQKVRRVNTNQVSTLGTGKLLRIFSLPCEYAMKADLLLLNGEGNEDSGMHYWDTTIAKINSKTILNSGWKSHNFVKVVPRALISNAPHSSTANCKPVFLQLISDDSIAEGHIAVAPTVLLSLGAEELQRALLFPFEMDIEPASHFGVELCRLSHVDNEDEELEEVDILTKEAFLSWFFMMGTNEASSSSVIILSKGLVLHLQLNGQDIKFYVNRIFKLAGDSDEEVPHMCFHRTHDSSVKLEIDVIEGAPVPITPRIESSIDYQEWWMNTWLQKKVDNDINFLKAVLVEGSRRYFDKSGIQYPGGLLLHGPSGSGKTILSKSICHLLCGHKYLVKPIWVDCEALSGKNLAETKSTLQNLFARAVECQPALMVFDNLGIFHNSQVMTQESLENFQFEVISEYIAELMVTVRATSNAVAFLANARSLDSLHEGLKKSGCFDHHTIMTMPSDTEKGEIFLQLALSKGMEIQEDTLQFLIKNCDGCDIADMQSIIELCLHGLLSQCINGSSASLTKENKIIMLKEDIQDVVTKYIPAKARGVAKVPNNLEISAWEEIRGMPEACHELEEALSISSKYSAIMQKCPLRLRTGGLLYGPPGCGKTYIVRAAAKVCNLRVISVKGPELLNKYIGASEAGVRDLFRRASAAAPCILFFDEFDAIAPKRGHDNTGVTDRVVNQFLTELDGVESLVGVFVIAATSRPDLIDVALLRPGRLDRMIYCPFPNEIDRFDILIGACKSINLSPDVGNDTLLQIARSTDGYSGADLVSIVTDAQLEAAKAKIKVDCTSDTSPPLISKADLLSAVENSAPSVKGKDRMQLDIVYDTFNSSSKSTTNSNKGKNLLHSNKRVTHA